jgi:hypothetical protein
MLLIYKYILPISMNAFYERLTHFAELVRDASRRERYNYAKYFKVQHPSYPVIGATRSVMPKLVFEEDCPTKLRLKIRHLLKKSFNRIRNKE